jgi:hypothetical protein
MSDFQSFRAAPAAAAPVRPCGGGAGSSRFHAQDAEPTPLLLPRQPTTPQAGTHLITRATPVTGAEQDAYSAVTPAAKVIDDGSS